MFKYGSSIGVAATPTIYVNGVRLDAPPTTEQAWKDLLKEVYPAPATTSETNEIETAAWKSIFNDFMLFTI